MSANGPTEADLATAIETAAETALRELFTQYPVHDYYVALITTGEGTSPTLAAWSNEALEEAVSRKNVTRQYLKWSYADSPFLGFGANHFRQVHDLFAK